MRPLRGRTLGQLTRATHRRMTGPARRRMTPLRNETFLDLNGRPVPYFVHSHNRTWTNERSIELRLAQQFVASVGGRGMEFGNVLTRYGLARPWTIVDKYETGLGIANIDIVDFEDEPFDFIVSVSTLEHVGWDEDVREPEKVVQALYRLLSLLKTDGRLFLTAGLHHSEFLDAAVLGGRMPCDRQLSYVRDRTGRWSPAATLGARGARPRADIGSDSVWVMEARGSTLTTFRRFGRTQPGPSPAP